MSKVTHLIVEVGEEKGMQIHIPPEGARLGRSSKNNIVLLDPQLSRHHCRIFFKSGGGLWVTDLGSANLTLVNDIEIQESPLALNDVITLGDTLIRVVQNTMDGIPPIKVADNEAPQPLSTPEASVVDLGLSPQESNAAPAIRKKPIITVAVIAAAIILLSVVAKMQENKSNKALVDFPEETDPVEHSLMINYEKVEATTDNIFRYKLVIDPKRTISIEIDDIKNNRHLRKDSVVSEDLIQDLASDLMESDFFTLDSEYVGLQPNEHNLWKLTIIIDDRAHSVKVENRIEPALFKEVKEAIEIFGKNELGIWAVQFTTETLIEMAKNEYLQGKKLYGEREVQDSNIFDSIKNFKRAELDLETVDPKPDFYSDLIASKTEAEEELEKRFKELSYSAIRYMQLTEWDNAARELRIICNMIPSKSDDRNKDASTKLRRAESRLDALK